MFGTSGIRGRYGELITEALALKIGNAFAYNNVVVGRDTRKTGPTLAQAATAGILSAGKDAIKLGVVPTPTVALATKKHHCNGIMVTASHNPDEYNGLKLMLDGKEISREEEQMVLSAYERGIHHATWDNVGRELEDRDILEDHCQLVVRLAKPEASSKKLTVVIDCNGAGSVITPYLFRELGCRVISLNAELEGFNRPSEPNEKNLQHLFKIVRSVGADFAIAHDGDADRTIIVDENGEMLGLDSQLALMVEHELEENNRRGKIVTTMESSLIVRETAERLGASVFITSVGSSSVADELEKTDAIFGGEPAGEYIFRDGVHVPDGILSAVKFLSIYQKRGKFGILKKRFTPYPVIRERFHTAKKSKDMQNIRERIRAENFDAKISESDGIRIDFTDGWFLIRESGTEPLIRLTMEFKSEEKLKRMAEKIRIIITAAIKEK